MLTLLATQRKNCVRSVVKAWLLRILAGMTLATMVAVTLAQVSLSAHEEQDRQGIEGVWDVAVTIRQCDTGTPIVAIHAMNMFIQGGTLTETANDALRSSSLGDVASCERARLHCRLRDPGRQRQSGGERVCHGNGATP